MMIPAYRKNSRFISDLVGKEEIQNKPEHAWMNQTTKGKLMSWMETWTMKENTSMFEVSVTGEYH